MITLALEHAAVRAAAALVATLAALNSGTVGASISLYATERPANAAASGAAPLVVFTLAKPAGEIVGGVLTLATSEDALILLTGVALWARFSVSGATLFDCDVSDTTGTATIQLATTQLYAGGSVRLTLGVLG